MGLIKEVPQLARGRVWCTVCGHTMMIDSGDCMESGWPKCCSYTMTIDSPEERAARTASLRQGHHEP